VFGLDVSQSFDFFVGGLLSQVCVGQNELILHFDNDTRMLVESELRIRSPHAESHFSDSVEAGRAATYLLGLEVSSARAMSDRTLRIEFGTAASVEVYDSESHYESFTVMWPGGTIVV
jgi:hypothetical protein